MTSGQKNELLGLEIKIQEKEQLNSTRKYRIPKRIQKKFQNYLNLPHFHDSRENMKEELTAIGKELLKDLLERVFVHLSIWALLFIKTKYIFVCLLYCFTFLFKSSVHFPNLLFAELGFSHLHKKI